MRHQLAYTIAVSLTLWIASCAGSDDESTPHDDQGFLIPLAKCCDVGEFYNAGFDSCLERDTLDMEVPGTYLDSNGTGHAVAPSAFLVSLTNLTICPNGYVVKTSTDFQIFEDGSLKTADGIVREPGEFCVNRIVSDSDSTAPLAMFASRLCIADPCANSSTGCIHKCCPTGMILNETERLCQPSSVPFVIPFHDESGTPLLPPTSVIVRDGVFVDCKHGAYSLRPSTEEDEEFYVLPNGRIHLPAIREYVDDYCIDQFASEDGTVTIFLVLPCIRRLIHYHLIDRCCKRCYVSHHNQKKRQQMWSSNPFIRISCSCLPYSSSLPLSFTLYCRNYATHMVFSFFTGKL